MQLVADIGGTNARLAACAAGGGLEHVKSSKNAEFPSFDRVLSDYIEGIGATPKGLVVAIAGPVSDGVGRLTNLPWVVNQRELTDRYGCAVAVINDLTALGFAALDLSQDQIIRVDPVTPAAQANRQALVVGIGTGFNVSSVVDARGHIFCPAAEAGHASLPSRVTKALDILQKGLGGAFDSVESLFSGQGRRRFLSALTGQKVERATPAIAALGEPGNQALDAALDAYAQLIGYLLLDFKLTYMPSHGVFLAGGVARSSLIAHRAGLCRDILNAPNQFLPAPVPVSIINDDCAALAGCIQYANLSQASG